MKKESVLFGLVLVFSLFSFSSILAVPCDLDISLINQDPYPAVQNEEARLVFQIDGIENTECGTVEFGLVEQYPFTLMPDQEESYKIEAGTFKKDFQSFFLAPFKIKISPDAMDGDNKIEVKYRYGTNTGYVNEDFNINIQDTRADFEVHVKSYDAATKRLSFEVLNIADEDINALTVEIPKQENIEIKGANRKIVGDLDSNDYTTAEFEAVPKNGNIKLLLHYSDQINERRIIEKEVEYESDYFTGLANEDQGGSSLNFIILLIIAGLIIWWIVSRRKKKKKLEKLRAQRSRK